MSLSYDYQINKFCEKKIYSDQPEYINAFTSLFLCYISYVGLHKSEFLKKTISFIYWTIFVNGIGSFLYHWYSWYIFKIFDEFSMILPIWISLCDILFSLKYPTKYIGLITLYNILLLVFDVFLWFDDYFPIFFGIDVGLIIPLYYQAIQINKDIDHDGFKGIMICLFSALTWVITENYCNKYLIFGHAVWHIGMGVGTNYLIKYFNNLSYNEYKHIV